MGAFFLFKSDEQFDINSVQKVFNDKGFTVPAQFALNNMTLWIFKKQLVNDNNYYLSKNGTSVFATGTVVYKGKNYRDTLRNLAEDFDIDTLDKSELIGAFCIIFFKKGKIYILTDRANIYHIFINDDQPVLSSSFLALIAAGNKKRSLNRMSCLEQILIGYTVGHETLIKGISLINNLYKIRSKNCYLSFISYPEKNEDKSASFQDYNDCINHQLKLLKSYYQQLGAFVQKYDVDIGLSGGYDSRLNFLLASTLPTKISAHTHYSVVHSEEKEIAELIAEKKGVVLRAIPISNPAEMSEIELIDNLSDALYFYDGRTNRTMGTFNDVHTRKYRIAVLKQNKLGLNGLGGELYRNYNQTIYRTINFAEWIKYHVIDPSIVYSITDRDEMLGFIDHTITKYGKLLNLDTSKYVDAITLRNFYAFIWLPYAAGIKSQAENQLAFFLMPFSEYRIVCEALKASPFIGTAGKLEAAMMMRLDSEIARIPSSYGFGFDKEPLSYIIKSSMRCLLPDRVKNILGLMKIKYQSQNTSNMLMPFNQRIIIKQIYEILHTLNMPISWDKLFLFRAHFERSISIGYMLHKFTDKISL